MQDNSEIEVGLTKAISLIYLLFSIGIIIAVSLGSEINGIKLNIENDIWLPLSLSIVAIATIRRTKWGRWLSYLISFFFLFGVPIGTLIGGYMIWHLTKYKLSFNKWY